MNPQAVRVELGDRSYDVVIGKGLGPEFRDWFSRNRPPGGTFVVTDRTVAGLHGDALGRFLPGAAHRLLALPPGEASKTWETVREIYAFLAGGADRGSLVVAFGGGVVGDLAGFAAATFLRGIPYVQIPTTLLAQVDSGVGGKTGFNLPEGKNLVGAFHQPRAVFVDREFLSTLDPRNLRAGMAEIAKCALAGDASLWESLVASGASWESMDDGQWQSLVTRAVAFKASVVARDEREASARRILNLGHTVGHAVERAAGYGRILHGEAVAMGLSWEILFSARQGVTPGALAAQACELLRGMGFALDDPSLGTDAVASGLGADKKRAAADLLVPMVAAPGSCVIRSVPLSLLAGALAVLRAEAGVRPGAAPAPPAAAAATPVRTVTMAGVLWDQGRESEAREIVREILREDPKDPRALAWLAEREPRREAADPASRLSALLGKIAKEYAHDLSRPV